MLEKIILFHKKDLGSFKLVFEDIMWVWWLLIFASIISGVGAVLISINYWSKIVIIPLIGLFFTAFFILNWMAKRKLISDGIASEGFIWGGVGYQKKRFKLMQKYLKGNGINNDKDKIKLLIELLYKRSEKNQSAGLVGAGLLLAIFIPLWTQFLNWLFKIPVTIEQVFQLFASIFLIISMIVVDLHMIQMMAIDILDRERKNVRDLARMLEELLLEL